MAQGKVIKAIRFLKKQLKQSGVSDLKIILFGSQNRKNVTAQSDIDVLVVSDIFKNKSIFQRAMITKEAEINTIKKFMLPLDIITLSLEEANNRNELLKYS